MKIIVRIPVHISTDDGSDSTRFWKDDAIILQVEAKDTTEALTKVDCKLNSLVRLDKRC